MSFWNYILYPHQMREGYMRWTPTNYAWRKMKDIVYFEQIGVMWKNFCSNTISPLMRANTNVYWYTGHIHWALYLVIPNDIIWVFFNLHKNSLSLSLSYLLILSFLLFSAFFNFPLIKSLTRYFVITWRI